MALEKPERLPEVPVTHQGPEWNDEPQGATGLQVKGTETEPRDFGKARLVMKDGQATLIVKR